MKGLAILQEHTEHSANSREKESFSLLSQAVIYNPGLAESWINLALLSFKLDLCAEAAEFFTRAAGALSETVKSQQMKELSFKMKELSKNNGTCRKEGENSTILGS